MPVTLKELMITVSTNMEMLRGDFGKLKGELVDTEEKSKKVKSGFDDVKGSLLKLAGVIGTGMIFKNVISSTTEFESHIANLNTLLKDQPGMIGELEQGFLDLAGPLGSAGELAAAAYDAISGGVEPGMAVEFIGQAAMFAKANLIELKDATDVLTTIMNTYGASAGSAAEITDTLTTVVRLGKTHGDELAQSMGQIAGTAANVGISFNDLSAAIIGLTAGGVKTSTAMTSLKAIIANIAQPTDAAKTAAGKLGIQFNLAGLESKGLAGFLKDLTEKAKGNTQAQTDLFGSVEAFNAIAVLTSEVGMKKMADAQVDLKNKTDATKTAFAKQQETFDAVFKALKNEVEAVLIQAFLPALKNLSNWIAENKDEVIGAFKDMVSVLEGLGKVIGVIIEVLPALKEGFENVISARMLDPDLIIGNLEEVLVGRIEGVAKKFGISMDEMQGYIDQIDFGPISDIEDVENIEVQLRKMLTIWKDAASYENAVRGFGRSLDTTGYVEFVKKIGPIPVGFKNAGEQGLFFQGIIEGIKAGKYGENLAADWKLYEKGQLNAKGAVDLGTVAIEIQGGEAKKTAKEIITFNDALKQLQEKAKSGTLNINDLTRAYDNYYPAIVETEKKTKDFVEVLDALIEDSAPEAALELEAIRAVLTDLKQPTDDWMTEIEGGIIPMENFAGEVSYTADMSRELYDETVKMSDIMSDLPGTIEGTKAKMKELAERYERGEITQAQFDAGIFILKEHLEELQEKLKAVIDGINFFGGAMQLILPSMGDFIGKMTGIFSGLQNLSSAFTTIGGKLSVDFSSAFSAGLSVLQGIASIIGTTEWEKYGGHMANVLGLSDAMADRLAALSAEMEGVNGALYVLMDEIITDEKVDNFEDFSKWLREIARMMPAVAGGATDIRELEEAFTALLSSSGDIGYLGRAFHEITGNAAELGLELESIADFMENEMVAGADGYRAAMEANFTGAIIPMFDEYLAYQDKIADNKELVDGVEGWGRAIDAFGNLNRTVLQTDMDALIQGTLDGYDDLIEKAGFSVPEALALIAPQLGTLIALSEDHGLALDDNIQSLIDLADENGISVERRKTAEEELIEVLRELVEVMRGELSPAIDNFANEAVRAFTGVKGSIYDANGELINFLNTIPDTVGVTADFGNTGGANIEPPGFQSGTHGRYIPTPREFIVHGTEKVQMGSGGRTMKVTPMDGGGSAGVVQQNTFNVYAMDSKGVREFLIQNASVLYDLSKTGNLTIANRAVI